MFRLLLRRLSAGAEAAAEKHVAAAVASAPTSSPSPSPPLPGELYRRITEVRSPHLPLAPVLERWDQEGRAVEKHDVQGIVKKLIGIRRYAHALELSVWMTDQRHFHLSPGDVAYRLDLISKVHGLQRAVEYFGTLPEQLRKHHTYVSLLKCYVEAKAVKKAEELFAKMQEMGMKGAYSYSLMMKLYLKTRQVKRVHAIFRDMKEKCVEPDVLCVENLLAAYIAAKDVEGVRKMLEKANLQEKLLSWHGLALAARFFMKSGMQETAFKAFLDAERRITATNGKDAYNFMLHTYADLAMYPEVERIWSVYKSKVPPCNVMYLGRIRVLLKMNDIDGAEKALKEWGTKCGSFLDIKLVNLVVGAYCRQGLVEKAVALVDDAVKHWKKPGSNMWYKLADAYFKNGEVVKAVDMTRKALASSTYPFKPNLTYVLMCLNHFMEQKDVEAAEEMTSMLWKLIPLTRDVYHCLLRTYVRAGKPVLDLLGRMKEDGLEADEETNRILAGEC